MVPTFTWGFVRLKVSLAISHSPAPDHATTRQRYAPLWPELSATAFTPTVDSPSLQPHWPSSFNNIETKFNTRTPLWSTNKYSNMYGRQGKPTLITPRIIKSLISIPPSCREISAFLQSPFRKLPRNRSAFFRKSAIPANCHPI